MSWQRSRPRRLREIRPTQWTGVAKMLLPLCTEFYHLRRIYGRRDAWTEHLFRKTQLLKLPKVYVRFYSIGHARDSTCWSEELKWSFRVILYTTCVAKDKLPVRFINQWAAWVESTYAEGFGEPWQHIFQRFPYFPAAGPRMSPLLSSNDNVLVNTPATPFTLGAAFILPFTLRTPFRVGCYTPLALRTPFLYYMFGTTFHSAHPLWCFSAATP